MFCIVALATGCAELPKETWVAKDHSVPPLIMPLAAGDVVELSFFGAPELNVTQAIRRDGKITLRLIGELQAAGKRPDELRNEVTKLYESQLQIKEVSVFVKSPAPVFVTGSVLNPAKIPTDRPLTVLEAISEAGGVDARTAEVRSVVVIRHENGRRSGYIIDLEPALAGQPGDAFYLKPFDIVYVPRTQIVKVNQWVDQYIRKMLPNLGIGYDTGDGSVSVYR
jgi:polysaccharide export outer membrane protein